MERTAWLAASVIGVIIFGVAGFALGGGFTNGNTTPPSTSSSTPVIAAPTHIQQNQYKDEHLSFQMTVPDDWLNRFAAVENGSSVSFAFETAVSSKGVTQLQLSDVFTIYRYPTATFNNATCHCTELGRNKTTVYVFVMDGDPAVKLAPPLTAAAIAQELTDQVAGTFTIQ